MDKSRTKPPSLLACLCCRRSHLKCDGQKPLCRRCAERGSECLWMESRRGYRDYQRQHTPPKGRPGKDQRPQQSQHRLHDNSDDTEPFDFATGQGIGSNGDSFILDGTFAGVQSYSYEQLFDSSYTSAGDIPAIYNDSPFNFAAFQMPIPTTIDPMSSPGASTGSSTRSTPRDTPPYRQQEGTNEPINLIDIFYKYFYPSHPFVVPPELARQQPDLLPTPLRATMRFLAAHYIPNHNITVLHKAAQQILSDRLPDNVFTLQGLMIYAVSCFARYEQSAGALALDKAIRLALRIGVNKHSFAMVQAPSNPILQESFRRTWWALFLIDGLVTAIGGQTTIFRLQNIFCDVPLPSDDTHYNSLYLPSTPRSLRQFRNRTFSEDPFPYSSHAYAIEAMYIMGAIFNLYSSDTTNAPQTSTLDPQVEAIDASISNFSFSLPPHKREVIPNPNTALLDETLLLAHMIINWASIQLHRPRSTLTFIRNHQHQHQHPQQSHHQTHHQTPLLPASTSSPEKFATLPTCTPPQPPPPAIPSEPQTYASHTTKALLAANTIIHLATLPRSLAHCSPTMMCAVTAAATVLLPGYALARDAEEGGGGGGGSQHDDSGSGPGTGLEAVSRQRMGMGMRMGTSSRSGTGSAPGSGQLSRAASGSASVEVDEYAAIAIRERLQLGISVLGRFAEIWPRAGVAKGQVAGFAREVLRGGSGSGSGSGTGAGNGSGGVGGGAKWHPNGAPGIGTNAKLSNGQPGVVCVNSSGTMHEISSGDLDLDLDLDLDHGSGSHGGDMSGQGQTLLAVEDENVLLNTITDRNTARTRRRTTASRSPSAMGLERRGVGPSSELLGGSTGLGNGSNLGNGNSSNISVNENNAAVVLDVDGFADEADIADWRALMAGSGNGRERAGSRMGERQAQSQVQPQSQSQSQSQRQSQGQRQGQRQGQWLTNEAMSS